MGNRTFNRKLTRRTASLMAILFTLVSLTSSAGMAMPAGGDMVGHMLHGHMLHENSAQLPAHAPAKSSAHCKMASGAYEMSCATGSHQNGSHQSSGHGSTGCQLLCAISCTPSILSPATLVIPCRSLAGTLHTLLPKHLPSTLISPPFKPPRQSN